MGALATAVRSGQGAVRRHLVVLAGAHPRGGRDPARAGHAAADPPAVVLDAQPLDRGRRCSTCSRRRASAASRSRRWRRACSPTATSTASPRTRAPRRASRSTPTLLTDEALAPRPGAQRDRQARGQSLAQLALAWVLRDPRVTSVLIGASSVAPARGQPRRARPARLRPTTELAAIDRHAVDAGINLWAGPARSERADDRARPSG